MSLFDRLFAYTAQQDAQEPPYYQALRAEDLPRAITLINTAIARQKDPHAMAVLGALYGLGRGVARDALESAAWFRQAANAGDAFGQTAFGVCLATGFGVERDDSDAVFWLYRAARAGHQEAGEVLRDLVMRNQKLVGEHFSQAQFLEVMRELRRPISVQ